jgi:hypothetical protein
MARLVVPRLWRQSALDHCRKVGGAERDALERATQD